MRIGINTLALNRQDLGGAETSLYYLIRGLADIDKENRYFVFVSPTNRSMFGDICGDNFATVVCKVETINRFMRVLYEQFVLPRLVKSLGIDVFHAPSNVLPLRLRCGSVLTVHILIGFVREEGHTPLYRRIYLNNLMRASAQKATRVVSVSENYKRLIVEHLRIPPAKVVVIPHGVDAGFGRQIGREAVEACRRRYGIEGEYILCVANNIPRKNLEGLLEGYEYARRMYKIPHCLVIAGNDGFTKERQEWLAGTKTRHPGELVHLGYVKHGDLAPLYKGAEGFVLTSFCESFGIPVLEAMACGVPVVASNTFAMPEVVGDAGVLVNPLDAREIGEGIYSIVTDEDLRSRLVERGVERARRYSWEEIAHKSLKVYEEVYESRHP